MDCAQVFPTVREVSLKSTRPVPASSDDGSESSAAQVRAMGFLCNISCFLFFLVFVSAFFPPFFFWGKPWGCFFFVTYVGIGGRFVWGSLEAPGGFSSYLLEDPRPVRASPVASRLSVEESPEGQVFNLFLGERVPLSTQPACFC